MKPRAASPKKAKLTLGPLVYHWPAEKRRDFYFHIADEAPIDDVYLGEIVCAKRAPLFEPYREEVIERLRRAGKNVILSSLALVTARREIAALENMAQEDLLVEANDVATVHVLAGKPFVIGPMIPVLNEGALEPLAALGAKRIVFASEMTGRAMAFLAGRFPNMETETHVFGHQPLAIALRCYHARAAGREKDRCRFACSADEDGLAVLALDGTALWTVTGTHTLSAGNLVLGREALELQESGVSHFRLAPQALDMAHIAHLYRALLDGNLTPCALFARLREKIPDLAPINGFYHGKEGRAFIEA